METQSVCKLFEVDLLNVDRAWQEEADTCVLTVICGSGVPQDVLLGSPRKQFADLHTVTSCPLDTQTPQCPDQETSGQTDFKNTKFSEMGLETHTSTPSVGQGQRSPNSESYSNSRVFWVIEASMANLLLH
uniref:Uncharacterized protein n=1 Tax=Knipowitschia caucasica TaxID=637954 RepID=A0AAV2JEK6_KNICA